MQNLFEALILGFRNCFHASNFNFQDSNYNPPMAATLPVRDALRNLKQSILSSPGNVLSHADTDTRDFLYNWLKNNKADYSKSLYASQVMTQNIITNFRFFYVMDRLCFNFGEVQNINFPYQLLMYYKKYKKVRPIF